MHERCEWKLRTALGETMDEPHSEYDTEETDQVTDVYAEFCLSTIEKMRHSGVEPLILIEERLDYSHIAPQGFGTGDLVLVGKDEDGTGLIHVIDFKGGRGVRVEAEMNSQMMLYAAAALNSYGFLVDPQIVRMSIVQPRLDNISTFQMTVEELNAWAESIKSIARMAYEGKGEQHTGDWCIFCKAKPVCRARQSLCVGHALRKRFPWRGRSSWIWIKERRVLLPLPQVKVRLQPRRGNSHQCSQTMSPMLPKSPMPPPLIFSTGIPSFSSPPS